MAMPPIEPKAAKPTYVKGRKPVTVKIHRLMDILAMMDQHGQAQQFQEAAKSANAVLRLQPKTANFIKDFVASHPAMSADPLGKKVQDQDCDGNFECQF